MEQWAVKVTFVTEQPLSLSQLTGAYAWGEGESFERVGSCRYQWEYVITESVEIGEIADHAEARVMGLVTGNAQDSFDILGLEIIRQTDDVILG